MNSPISPQIGPKWATFLNRTANHSLLLTVLLALSGFFNLPASGQALDAPDTIQRFPVGPGPWGMAFDGANIWVTSVGSDMVTELRASDGARLGTFPAGGASLYAAFDGTYIWVTNSRYNTVTRLRANDGSLAGTFPTGGDYPAGIVFDGASIWIAHFYSGTVTKLRATDGLLEGTVALGGYTWQLAFDGAHIWVTNVFYGTVTKLRASDGALLGTFAVGNSPLGVLFDGANIWVTNWGGGNGSTLTKLRASDGALLGTFSVGLGPYDVAYDGAHVWVLNNGQDSVMRLRRGNGVIQKTYAVENNPQDIIFDNTSIWVTHYDGNTVNKIITAQSNALTYPIANPDPTLLSIIPDNGTAGGPDFLLTLVGTNFVDTSTVQWNRSARATTFVTDMILVATITAADIAKAGSASLAVKNPPPGGGISNLLPFTINNPVPTVTSLSPDSETAGDSAFTLTVTGTNFVSTSVVQWNASGRQTTFVSSTTVTAAISAADIANGGVVSVTVMNPAPGGGISNSEKFTINNPVPNPTSLSPDNAIAGGPQFTLTVNGTNFVQASVVKWKGSSLTTTFVNSSKITAIVPASDIATAGTATIKVSTPGPGGGTSGSLNFSINNPVPAATSLTPSSKIAGDTTFTLKATGANFVATSRVQWDGHNRTTTFVDSTTLNASILDTDIDSAGTATVTVFNPTPGGGTSNGLAFTINNPVPDITNISPDNATAGGPQFSLTVNGTNFVKGSAVNWNGAALSNTHFVSSIQLTVTVPKANIANAGTASVTVTNPAPGGGTSNAIIFVINNPVPNLTSLSPSKKNHGGSDFTLNVHGTGFVSTSRVRWKGSNRTTTLVSGRLVQAAITAADIANPGTAQVTVVNPAPGGGTSNALTFTIN